MDVKTQSDSVSQSGGTAALPISDKVREALAIVKRGVDELLIESELSCHCDGLNRWIGTWNGSG